MIFVLDNVLTDRTVAAGFRSAGLCKQQSAGDDIVTRASFRGLLYCKAALLVNWCRTQI